MISAGGALSPLYLVQLSPGPDLNYHGFMARESILIIDEDTELARIIGLFLNLQGFRVNHTTRARDAVTKLNLQKYAVIIIDPALGENNRAEEVLTATQDAGSVNAATPFILATKAVDYEVPNNSLPKIKAVLAKPFQLDELLEALRMAGAVPAASLAS